MRRANSRWQASAVPIIVDHVSAPVTYVPDFSAVAERVAEAANPGDVVVKPWVQGTSRCSGAEILAALHVKANRSAPGAPGTAFR